MVGEEGLCGCLLASARAVDRQFRATRSALQRPLCFANGGGMLSSTQSIVVDNVFHSTSQNRLGTAVRQLVQTKQLPRGFGAPQHTLESVTISPSRCYCSDK
jgi:hypothetical protein